MCPSYFKQEMDFRLLITKERGTVASFIFFSPTNLPRKDTKTILVKMPGSHIGHNFSYFELFEISSLYKNRCYVSMYLRLLVETE
jgi:hypothetical protein